MSVQVWSEEKQWNYIGEARVDAGIRAYDDFEYRSESDLRDLVIEYLLEADLDVRVPDEDFDVDSYADDEIAKAGGVRKFIKSLDDFFEWWQETEDYEMMLTGGDGW